MVDVSAFYQHLKNREVNFFAGVPDSLLKDICAYITDHATEEEHVITANEGSAVGLAVGYHLATGKTPLVYMQNSGLGNIVNPVLSIADDEVYGIPMVLLIGWRGEPNVKDEPQHIKQGKVTDKMLEAMGIPYVVIDQNTDYAKSVDQMVKLAGEKSCPVAILIKKNTFSKYKFEAPKAELPLSREEALKLVVDNISQEAIVISTTGKLSRELFEYREDNKQGHGADFLTVGAMGHTSQIALGVSLQDKSKQVYCLDGDGSVIMHMGSLATNGRLADSNFSHIVFNNGAHESVGGQPSFAFDLDIPAIAKSCGYKSTMSVSTEEDLLTCLEADRTGSTLIEIKVSIDSRDDLGRPTTTPKENKVDFMNFIQK
jgi:phosphonopyruvate decarboxylase